MILKVNTPNKKELSDLFDFIKQQSPYYRFLPNELVIVAPKLKASESLKKFAQIDTILEIDTPYQLASKRYKSNTSITIKGETISNNNFNLIAGPCSVESEEQIFATAELLHKLGIKFIRGGAYKPRTSPYSFMGLGIDGLKLLHQAAKQYNLAVVTEIMDISLLDEVIQYADILQVGSRNMHNFYMLNELGKTNTPVLLKRGMSATINEWLLAAEYILSGGNPNIILCERGIRSFDSETRNVMDIGAIPLLNELSHLPIIADPSHGTGASSRVQALSMASIAAGANGLIIEVHPNPKQALSDSAQAINFSQLETLKLQIDALRNSLNTHSESSSILKLQTL